MLVRNRIWEELKQSLVNMYCLERYIDRGRKRLRWFNTLIIILPTTGALGGGIFDNKWIAIISAIATALVAILKAVLPNLIQTEQELTELDRLLEFYARYKNQLERLWYETETEEKNEEDAIKQLFEIKDTESEKYSLLNKGIRSLSEREEGKIQAKCDTYLNRAYSNNYDE